MAIVAVAREMGARGEEIAAAVAASAGLRVIDREDIQDTLEKAGLSREKREKFDEKKPSFLASLSPARDDYLHFLKTVVLREALTGNVLFIGRGAGAILATVPGLVSVKLIAPKHQRVGRVMQEAGLEEKRAEQLLARSDHDRQGFHHFFFGMDWNDPAGYDMVLNTASIAPADAVEVILSLIRRKEAAVDPTRTRRRLEALNLSQTIVTEVLYTRKIPVQFLEAECQDGHVTLHGVSSSRVAIEQAVAAAQGILGVVDVQSEIQVVQEYAAIP